MSSQQLRDSLALLRTRRFGTFWSATLLSNLGFWAQEVAQPWLLLSLGASSFLIGVDAFVAAAPAILLTVAGGVLADHYDRRRIITVFQGIQMLCPIALVILLVTGTIQPWIVIALSFVVGATDAVSMPSYQSIVPSVVEPRQISTGIALTSTQYNLSRILGPAAAGVLIASVGVVGCFVVNIASYIPFILVALWILPRHAPTRAPFVRTRMWSDLRAGLQPPQVRGALLVVFTSSLLCGPLITFCPVLVKSAFGGDAAHFSLVITAFGGGGLLGALILVSVDPARDLRRLSSFCAVGYAFVVLGAGIAPWFWALPLLVLLAGLLMTVSNTAANTLLQTTSDPALHGQTVSMYMLAIRGGIALGSIVTGAVVYLLGVREALAINGLLAVVCHLILRRAWLRRAPAVRCRSTDETLDAKI